MNIYALPGHKVIVNSFPNWYYPIPPTTDPKEVLYRDSIYTVAYTKVSRSWTEVYLLEVPDIAFPASVFRDKDHQPEYMDRKHPDYLYYHSGLLERKRLGSGFKLRH